MSRDWNAHAVRVVAAPTTLLGQIAAVMPNRSWVYMNGTSQYGVTCTTPSNFKANWYDPYSAGGLFAWGNKMAFNPILQTIEYHGEGSHAVIPRHLRYSLSDNSTGSVPLAADRATFDAGPLASGHCFESLTCNPFTGQMYWRRYGNPGNIKRFTNHLDPFADLEDPLTICPNNGNIYAPLDWWYGPITGGGAQGLLTLLSVNAVGGGSKFDFYDPLLNTWLSGTVVPTYIGAGFSYNFIGAYSRTKNVCVFGGSNQYPTYVFKVLSDRSCVRMSDTPGGRNISCGSCSFVPDPLTGNFLVHFNDRSFYELDPDGNGGLGTWTLLSPVPNGGALGTVSINVSGSSNGCGTCSLQALGITVWISNNGGDARMHIYKHGT